MLLRSSKPFAVVVAKLGRLQSVRPSTSVAVQQSPVASEPDATSILTQRDKQYEVLAWEMFDDMLGRAEEYGHRHMDQIDEIAVEARTKYAYKLGELSGQRELVITKMGKAFRERS